MINLENIDLKRAYEVSTKGLCLDDQGRVLVQLEEDGWWELPGGGLDYGEGIIDGLKRECREELGVECEVLDAEPYRVWVGITPKEVPRLILLYRIKLLSTDFKLTSEAVEVKFVTLDELRSLKLVPQLNGLKAIL